MRKRDTDCNSLNRSFGNYPFTPDIYETTCNGLKQVWCGWPVSRVLSRSAPKGGAGMTIHLGPRLPTASCDLPGQRAGGGPGLRALSSLSDLAPGGACRAAPVTGGAVSSYLAVSPLPEVQLAQTPAVCSLWRFPWGSELPPPPPGVTRHRTSVEPGLSSRHPPKAATRGHPAIRRLHLRG